MNIGDQVQVNCILEVVGIKRDHFSTEILIEGKVMGEEGHHFITVPEKVCKLMVWQPHVL